MSDIVHRKSRQKYTAMNVLYNFVYSHSRRLFVVIIVLSYNVIAFSNLRSLQSNDGVFIGTESIESWSSSGGVVTIPLIPYHVYRRRNLKAALEYEKQNRESGYATRHRRYHHRNLDHVDGHTDEQSYSAQQVAALYQGYGTHYADLWCGTPPQRQTVIVDTGSGVTAFPCSQCKDCGVPDYHIDALFNEHESSTFRALSCDECLRGSCSKSSCVIGQAYQEGSTWNAFEAADSCYIGGLHKSALDVPKTDDKDDLNPYDAKLFAFNMIFGCQTKLTNLFVTQLADGIMGMDVAESSFWWQMFNANKIQHKSFSLCFNRKEEADPEGTESGAMSLGGTDPRLHISPMVYTTTRTGIGSGFYNVDIKKVWLREAGGGDSATPTKSGLKHVTVDLSQTDVGQGARVIVDSGTTDTYFSRSFGSAFTEAWKELTGERYTNNPLSLTAEELDKTMPTIIIQLNGDVETNTAVREGNTGDSVTGLAGDLDPDNYYDVLIAIPPSHYFEYDEEKKVFESRFFVNDSSGGVIGANSMMGHDVYFDIERNRMGWAESKCDYISLVAPYIDGGNDNIVPAPAPADNSNGDDGNTNSNGDNEGQDGNNNDSGESTGSEGGDTENNNEGNGGDGSGTDGDSNQDGDWTDSENPMGAGDGITLPGGVCSDFTCQLVVTVAVISVILCVAYRIVRKPVPAANYDLADGAELELAEKSSYDDDEYTGRGSNGNGVKYRNGDSIPVFDGGRRID